VLPDINLRAIEYKGNVMTEETLRTKSNNALWLAIGIMLVPLVPYALGGAGA
jgi:hypothetical protein